MTTDDTILCAGEILWDALPAGLFLGGAPLNVAFHLHALGGNVRMVSRVGDDILGREALRRMQERGMTTDDVQLDETRDTGFVRVSLDEQGVPEYEIVQPVAWDYIKMIPALEEVARESSVVVFGTLAQRNPTSRAAIRELTTHGALTVLDVNLRTPYDTWPIVRDSLKAADIVKMSEEEFEQIVRWSALGDGKDLMATFASHFDCDILCITRGSNGSLLWRNGQSCEHSGFTVDVVDTVGVGDAFLAGLLSGVLAGRDDAAILEFANRVAAFVATQFGPTPRYEMADLDAIANEIPSPP